MKRKRSRNILLVTILFLILTTIFVIYLLITNCIIKLPFLEICNTEIAVVDWESMYEYHPLPVEQNIEKEVEKGDVKGTFVQPKGSVKIPVLMYHNIAPVPTVGSYNYRGLYVSPGMFDQQMRYLKDNGYRTLTPQQFYDQLKTGKNPRRKSVLITFDDGTKGQYTSAYPILKKYGLTATFYIVSDRLQISATQLRRMSNNGMIIDSHSSTHKDLKVLDNRNQLRYEINSSKAKLQGITNKKIVSIAYPGCVGDSQSFNQVASSGYLLGFSCGRTIYHYYSHRFYLSRVHVYSNMTSFKNALAYGL